MNIAVIENPVRLSLTRSFDACPEAVFDAWLQESWGDWLGPEGVVGLSSKIDPRVGGAWRILSRTPDGSEVVHHGIYKEINRSSRLMFTWHGCSAPNETMVTLTFKAKGAGTEMTLTHEGFLDQEARDRHNGGWNGTLDRLAHQLG
jgi:uncharacterized protein YndB with AHSA1/START domain